MEPASEQLGIENQPWSRKGGKGPAATDDVVDRAPQCLLPRTHRSDARAFGRQDTADLPLLCRQIILIFEQIGSNMSIATFLSTYRPTHVNQPAWTMVGPIVREAIFSTTGKEQTARRYCSHAAAFACWASSNASVLGVREVFDLDLIERYVATGMPGAADSTRATRRAILRRIAHKASPELSHLPAPAPISYRRIRPPYEPSEISGFLRLAQTQPTRGRRLSVLAVLCLGLGCGLDCGDMGWVRGCDVQRDAAGFVTVRVAGGSRPRTVVSLARFEDDLQELAVDRGNELLIGGRNPGRHNVTSTALARMITDDTLPRLVVGRLRSTWLLEHLCRGTPLPIVIAAAGLTTVRPLEDLLHHLPAADPEVTAALLRGSA